MRLLKKVTGGGKPKRSFGRARAGILGVALAAVLAVGGTATAFAATGDSAGDSSQAAFTTVSDAATVTDYESLLGTGKADNPITTANIGRIWTDKSVFTGDASDGVITVKKADGADFLTSLSAISSTSNLTSMSNTPLDIVLVLDASGSMDYSMSSDSTATTTSDSRIYALKQAANAFIDQIAAVNDKVSDTNLQHKVSLVKFAGDNSSSVGNETYSSGGGWGSSTKYNYSQTMMNLTTCTSDAATNMKAMINNISPGGATQAGYGMSHAKDELDNNGRSNAKKIVIFFTDGTPTSSSSWEDAVASSAVSYANQMKTNGATIYGINILNGSDATSDPTSSSTSNVNKFMHAVSSNYPSATYTASSSSSSSGRPGPGGGSTTTYTWSFGDRSTTTDSDGNAINYFKTATSADELSEVFKDIEQQIVNGAGYPTKATDGAADTSGYIVMDDELGSYMEVSDLSTLVYNGKIYSNPTKSTTGNVDTYTFEGDVTAGASASNLNKIIITVTRSTDLATGDKVQVKVPASLIPLHHYNIDLTNTKMTADSTTPVVVCYSSAVKSGVAEKLANPDDAMKAYMAANTDSNGNVKFYANKWSGDANKGDVVAAFEPSDGNLYYYYTSDTALYTDKNFTTQATSIDENATYYYKHSYYTMTDAKVDETAGTASGTPTETTEAIELPGSTAKTYQDAGNIGTDSATKGLFVKDGTPRLNFINTLHKAKAENTTGTASDVLKPEWASAATLAAYNTINSHLGNNGTTSYFGNLNVKVTNNGGNADDEFEVTVELKDGSGDPISGTFGEGDDAVTFTDGKAVIKLKGDENKTISNVPAGATYTVTQTGKDGYSATYTVNGGDPSSTPATGNIDPDNAQNVVVSNEYQGKTATVERDGNTVSVNGQLVGAGEEITYTIGWVNSASVKADVTITDELPDGLEFVNAEDGSYDEGTSTVTWSLKDQEAGATGTVAVKAKVSEAFSGNSITNGATVQLSDASGVISTYKPTPSTVDVPMKLVTGAAADGTVKIGDELTYTVSFTVEEAVDSAVVTDALPAGTEYVEGSAKCDSEGATADTAFDSSKVTWTFGKLATGTYEVSFKVKVTAAAASLTNGIENQATVKIGANGSELKTNKTNNKLSTGKLDVELVNYGGSSDDTFDVTVKLTDPNGSPISGTFGEGDSKATFDENGELKYEGMKGGDTKTLTNLPSGATYTVTQTNKDGYTTTYTVNNTPKQEATGSIDPSADQKVVITNTMGKTATVDRSGTPTSADGQLVGVGEILTYTVNWVNNAYEYGVGVAATVVVTDVVPEGTELVEGSISGSGTCTDGTITWDLGEQAAGATGSVSFSVKVTDAVANPDDDEKDGVVTNTANIVVGNQPSQATNTSKVNAPTKFATRYPVTPEGTGTATSAETATVGDTLAYNVSFVVPTGATSATVTDAVPAGTEYVADSAKCNNEGIVCEAACENGIVTWKLSELTPGKTVTVTFEVKILASVDIATGVDNTAKVTPSNGPEVSTNKVHTSIAEPVIVKGSTDLKFAKILAGRDWTADDKFAFTIKAVTDGAPMPENTTVEVTSETAKSNDKVEFNFGDIKFATPGTYEYTVTETGNTATDVLSDQVPAKVAIVVTEDEGKLSAKTIIENETFDNVAVVKFATFANTTANPDEPNVTAETGDDEEATEVKVGDVLQYTIPWSNTTGAEAIIVVTDTLAEGLTLDETTLDSSANYDKGSRTITWTIYADKTDSGTVGFCATVNSAAVKTIATDGTASLANTATVSVKDAPNVTATSKPFTSTVKTGEVDVSVVNNGGDPAKEFTVTVTVTDKGGNPVTGTFGGTTYDNEGKTTFTMKNGDDPTKLTGLPEGATVTVTQTAEDGYTTTYTVNSGDPTSAPANATVDPSTPQKVVITNTYAAQPAVFDTETALNFSKELTGRAWAVGDEFEFNLAGADEATQAAINDGTIKGVSKEGADTDVTTKADVTVKQGGGTEAMTFDFGKMKFTKAGTYKFKVTEAAGSLAGITYDTHEATFQVVVTDNGKGGLVASATSSNLKFTNKYESSLDYGAMGGLMLEKVLTDHAIAAGQFEWTLKASDEASANLLGIDAASGKVIKSTTASQNPDNSASEGISLLPSTGLKLTQENVGKTYTYTLAETNSGAKGYTYDTDVRTITIAVTGDSSEATITATTTVAKAGETVATYSYTTGQEKGDSAVVEFTNQYKASGTLGGDGSVAIKASKQLTGRDMVKGEFTFNVLDADKNVVATGTNDANGNITFSAINYDQTMLGEHKYTVVEDAYSMPSGVTPEVSEFAIVVNVADNDDGTLKITVDYPEGSESGLVFENTYGKTATATVNMNGEKDLLVLTGIGWLGPQNAEGAFTFTLTGEEGAPMPEGATGQTMKVTNKAIGSSKQSFTVDFGSITYTMDNVFGSAADEPQVTADDAEATAKRSKTFTYTVKESGSLPGVTNDTASTKTIKVTVTDNGDGALSAATTVDGKEKADGSNLFRYTNTYAKGGKLDPIDVVVTDDEYGFDISKTLEGRDIQAGEFKFQLTDSDGDVVATGTNDANGKVTMSAITFDAPGGGIYTLSEVNAKAAGVTYDANTYKVRIEVIDDTKGGLTITECALVDDDYNKLDSQKVTFENNYDGSAVVSVSAAKVLKNADLTAGQFKFSIQAVGDAPAALEQTVANDEYGSIPFTVEFTKEGTYTYKISEVNDGQEGITYDTTEHTVTFEVTYDAEQGVLVAQATTPESLVFTNVAAEKASPAPAAEPTAPASDNGNKASSAKTGDYLGPLAIGLLVLVVAGAVIATVAYKRAHRPTGKHGR
jgi:pilin isopeptide linkage protein/uncharacterized repeat protein (TIGR01451 family)